MAGRQTMNYVEILKKELRIAELINKIKEESKAMKLSGEKNGKSKRGNNLSKSKRR